MKPIVRNLIFILGLASPWAHAGLDEEVEKALNLGGGKYGKVNFDVRWRFENVSRDFAPALSEANASTIRTRIGYLTPEYMGFKAFAEYSGTHDAGADDYNDGTPNGSGNNKTRFPVIADPAADVLNQGWLSYSGLPSTTIKGGRQKIALDNLRFIGDVAWRQNQQMFDSVTLTSNLIPRTTLTSGYIFGVQNIYARQVDMSSPFLNVNFDTGFGKLIGYGYWLDYQRASDSNLFKNSTQTYGVRFDGARPITDKIKSFYTAEYALQSAYRKNPNHFQADYWLGETGLDIYGLTLKAAYEELGANNGVGFSTPLATLHIFQGWADQFLATPSTVAASGIRDIYGTIKYNLFGVDLVGMYHDFSDHTGSLPYGREFDVQAEKKFGKHYSVLIKYADFVADKTSPKVLNLTDTQKFWLQGSVSF